jgi:hypothetical protein
MIRSTKIAFSQCGARLCNFCTPPAKHFVKSYRAFNIKIVRSAELTVWQNPLFATAKL